MLTPRFCVENPWHDNFWGTFLQSTCNIAIANYEINLESCFCKILNKSSVTSCPALRVHRHKERTGHWNGLIECVLTSRSIPPPWGLSRCTGYIPPPSSCPPRSSSCPHTHKVLKEHMHITIGHLAISFQNSHCPVTNVTFFTNITTIKFLVFVMTGEITLFIHEKIF